MGGKQMEGDNRERRKRAKEAHDEGNLPSEEQVTLGASKQRHHVERDESQDDKVAAREAGKRDVS